MNREPNDRAMPRMVEEVLKAARPSQSDPLGSYTGVPADDPDATPVQDADDL